MEKKGYELLTLPPKSLTELLATGLPVHTVPAAVAAPGMPVHLMPGGGGAAAAAATSAAAAVVIVQVLKVGHTCRPGLCRAAAPAAVAAGPRGAAAQAPAQAPTQ